MPKINSNVKPTVTGIAERLAVVARERGLHARDLPEMFDFPRSLAHAALKRAKLKREELTPSVCRQADTINRERITSMIDRFNAGFPKKPVGGWWTVTGDPDRDPALNRELAERLHADQRLSSNARAQLAPLLATPTTAPAPTTAESMARRNERLTSTLTRKETKAIVTKVNQRLQAAPPTTARRSAPAAVGDEL